jgi:hypothetical protein
MRKPDLEESSKLTHPPYNLRRRLYEENAPGGISVISFCSSRLYTKIPKSDTFFMTRARNSHLKKNPIQPFLFPIPSPCTSFICSPFS